MGAKKLLLTGSLIVAVMVIYIPSLYCGFIWDDDYYVSNNPVLKIPGGYGKIWTSPGSTPQYYPMVFTTFRMEYNLFGENTFIFHLDNILLHAVNAVLLWILLVRLGLPWAWFAAFLFAFHPVQVESVTWIAERKNVLSMFFGLASMLVYFRFVMMKNSSLCKAVGIYLIAFSLFVCALLSKSVTATIPAVILVLLWWKRGRVLKRDILLMIPFFTAGLVAGLHTSAMEAGFVGASGPGWDFSIIERCLIAGRASWFYAAKFMGAVYSGVILIY